MSGALKEDKKQLILHHRRGRDTCFNTLPGIEMAKNLFAFLSGVDSNDSYASGWVRLAERAATLVRSERIALGDARTIEGPSIG